MPISLRIFDIHKCTEILQITPTARFFFYYWLLLTTIKHFNKLKRRSKLSRRLIIYKNLWLKNNPKFAWSVIDLRSFSFTSSISSNYVQLTYWNLFLSDFRLINYKNRAYFILFHKNYYNPALLLQKTNPAVIYKNSGYWEFYFFFQVLLKYRYCSQYPISSFLCLFINNYCYLFQNSMRAFFLPTIGFKPIRTDTLINLLTYNATHL